MWHPLLSPFCMATVILCLQWGASSRANSTGTGGLALAACLGLHLTKGKMAGGPTLGHTHKASLALSPQCRRAKATSAQRDGQKISINSPGFGGMAPDSGEIKGGPTSVMEVNMRLERKTHWAEQGTIVLLDECCFWNDIMGSFIHRVCRCLTHDLDLLCYGLILPVCKVTSILITVITGIQLLARCMKNHQTQRESKKQWPESLPSTAWGCSECAICLQAHKPRETLKLLSCSHAFHGKCIDLWHRVQPGSKTCPLCLRGVTAVALIPLGAHNSKRE